MRPNIVLNYPIIIGSCGFHCFLSLTSSAWVFRRRAFPQEISEVHPRLDPHETHERLSRPLILFFFFLPSSSESFFGLLELFSKPYISPIFKGIATSNRGRVLSPPSPSPPTSFPVLVKTLSRGPRLIRNAMTLEGLQRTLGLISATSSLFFEELLLQTPLFFPFELLISFTKASSASDLPPPPSLSSSSHFRFVILGKR